MLCDNCGKNEANVKYTQIINGVKKEMKLCEKCSKELGIDNFNINFNMPIDFSSFLGDLISDYEENSFMPMLGARKELKCKNCNTTYEEFLNTGKFGCSECYETFADKIDSVLKRIHGSNKYLGRKCKESVSPIDKIEEKNEDKEDNKMTKLENELKQAIKDERYEDAAKIRDEIKKIK